MNELIQTLEKIVDILTAQALDADQWVTVKPNGPENPGRPVLLGEGGEVKAGMGGKFNGKKLSEIPRTGKGGSAARSEAVKARGGIVKASSTKASMSTSKVKLDENLIKKANKATQGTVMEDISDVIQSTLEKWANEVQSFNLPDTEKENVVSALRSNAEETVRILAEEPIRTGAGFSMINPDPFKSTSTVRKIIDMHNERATMLAKAREASEKNDRLAQKNTGKQKTAQGNRESISAPKLDSDLIRRSDDGSGIYDRGKSIQNNYEANVKRINGLNISSAEKERAISALHANAMEQLKTTANSPSVLATGPARFNKEAMEKAGEKISRLGAQATAIIRSAEQAASKNSVAERHAAILAAARKATAEGALEFTFNGKTYRRKTTRSSQYKEVL